jgi:hypothetical protein
MPPPTAARLIQATRRMGASDEPGAVAFAGDVLADLAQAILETVARRPAGAADEGVDEGERPAPVAPLAYGWTGPRRGARGGGGRGLAPCW